MLGLPNDLMERIAEDEFFAPVKNQLDDIMAPSKFIGRAPQQASYLSIYLLISLLLLFITR